METQLKTGPIYWASYLINGDASGISDRDELLADEWVPAGWMVVDIAYIDSEGNPSDVPDDPDNPVHQEPSFTWSYDLYSGDSDTTGGEVVDYVLVKAPASRKNLPQFLSEHLVIMEDPDLSNKIIVASFYWDELGGNKLSIFSVMIPEELLESYPEKEWQQILDDTVAYRWPAERCQHEYDCCGHYYPNAAHVLGMNRIKWGDDDGRQKRMIQMWVQRSSTQNV